MRRILTAVGLNVLVPGSGLVLLGRDWLGLGVVVSFGATAELAALGMLLAPAAVPAAVTIPALCLAALTWVTAQFLLVSRISFLRDPRLAAELTALRSTAEKSLARGDAETAWYALQAALSVDASDLQTRVLWARLLTTAGQHKKARRAWRQVERLDRKRRFQTEIRAGLEQLEAA